MRAGAILGDRFELLRCIGAGGMAEVWSARDLRDGATVAVKILGDMGSQEASRRFEREAQILAQLSHPHIVRHLLAGTMPDGGRWLAMEWLDGEDLETRLARGPLPLEEALGLAGRAAQALGHAHSRSIVHRDVKPANLILPGGRFEDVHVVDFGIAYLGEGVTALTRTAMIIGTPGFMSPEQVRGEPVDSRTDVFALGAVLFECVAGQPAFTGPTPAAVLAKVLFHTPPDLGDASPGCPRSVCRLCARMLAKDPSLRPPDGQAVADEIRAALETAERDEAEASGRFPALGTGEMRLVSVVLASEAAADTIVDERTVPSASEPPPIDATTGRLVRMLDGTTAAVFEGGGEADAQQIAERAARCALALGGAVAVATGRAQIGRLVPVGEVIDRAARLAAAKRQGVRLDELTAGLVGDRFEIGGDQDGLLLLGARVDDEVRTLLGHPTSFVGRKQELLTLEAAIAAAIEEGTARSVLVLGESGVGKSRLRHELFDRLAARGQRQVVWMARGDASRSGSPLWLIARAIRTAAAILDHEPIPVRRLKLCALAARAVEASERERVAEFLCELCRAPFPDEHSLQLRAARGDALLMSDQIRRAVEDLVDAVSAREPLVLVLEDLHFADGPTVDLVGRLLGYLHARPLVVIGIGRPEIEERFCDLWASRGQKPIELTVGPLAPRVAERFVREMLGGGVTAEQVGAVVERSGGNPFFLEELVRAVSQAGSAELPATVVAIVQSRLESLEVDARRVLRAAAVVGETFGAAAVASLLGHEPAAVTSWLETLADRELLVRAGRSAAEEWAFRDVVVREGAYAMLTDEDRVLGHRLAGEWLEQHDEPDAGLIAAHLERAGEPTRAADHWVRAAEGALGSGDLQGATERAERALACGASGELRGAACLALAEALVWKGDRPGATSRVAEALELLPCGARQWYVAVRTAGQAFARSGDVDRLEAVARTTIDSSPAEGAEPARRRALAGLAWALSFHGRVEMARRLVGQVHAAPDGTVADPMLEAVVLSVRAYWALLEGEPEVHLELVEKALAELDRAGDARYAAFARGNLAYARIELGQYAIAEAELTDVIATSDRLGNAAVALMARSNLSLALLGQSRPAEARAAAGAALEQCDRGRDLRMEGVTRTYLAAIEASLGDLQSAERAARAAIEQVAAAPPLLAQARATLADVLVRQGRTAEARSVAAQAMDDMARHGAEEGAAKVELVWAEALRASGEHSAAAEAIGRARDRLLARAARIHSEELRRSFLEGVPIHSRIISLAGEWDRRTPSG